jgi:hypothetical protein
MPLKLCTICTRRTGAAANVVPTCNVMLNAHHMPHGLHAFFQFRLICSDEHACCCSIQWLAEQSRNWIAPGQLDQRIEWALSNPQVSCLMH